MRWTALAAAVAAVAVAVAMAAAGCGGDDDGGGGGGDGGGAPAALGRGGELFAERCARCHTLAAAGTDGDVGPNLDTLKPDRATVLRAIETGPGVMPSGLADGADAQAIADAVADNAGR
jgi:mono/diheme cytochrome c family protein